MTNENPGIRRVGQIEPDRADAIGAALAAMDPWLTLGYKARAISRSLQIHHPDLVHYLALEGGKVLGIATVRCPWLRGTYVERFAVLPGAQGRGLGGAMLRAVESDAAKESENLWLLVSGFNTRAQGFYASKGFSVIGEIPDLVAPGHTEILMRKILAESGPAGHDARRLHNG